MKKIIQQLCVFAILFSVTLSCYAHDFEVDGIYYNKNEDGKTVSVTRRGSDFASYSGSDALKVTGERGEIRIAGADGAVTEVYSLSGALLYCGTDATIALPRGMYVVKVAGTTTKVIL